MRTPDDPERPAYLDLLRWLQAAAGRRGLRLGLDRLTRALATLDPAPDFPVVQVAGTNGKGSTCAMAAGLLATTGLKVGFFSSPHLLRFTERFRVNGQELPGVALARLLPRLVALGTSDGSASSLETSLTYFEACVFLAAAAFGEAKVDVAVMETGLGGRLDGVTAMPNVVATGVSSIGLDHQEWLGDSLVQIAAEKAGISRPGVPLRVAENGVSGDVFDVLMREAGLRGTVATRVPVWEHHWDDQGAAAGGDAIKRGACGGPCTGCPHKSGTAVARKKRCSDVAFGPRVGPTSGWPVSLVSRG